MDEYNYLLGKRIRSIIIELFHKHNTLEYLRTRHIINDHNEMSN